MAGLEDEISTIAIYLLGHIKSHLSLRHSEIFPLMVRTPEEINEALKELVSHEYIFGKRDSILQEEIYCITTLGLLYARDIEEVKKRIAKREKRALKLKEAHKTGYNEGYEAGKRAMLTYGTKSYIDHDEGYIAAFKAWKEENDR